MTVQRGWHSACHTIKLAVMRKRSLFVAIIVAICLVPSAASAAPRHKTHVKRHHSHLKQQAAWTGAGLAAGQALGPAGSATVGVARHRQALRAGGRARNRAIVKIGAPIAAGAAFGPAGVIGYEGVEHRHWIAKHSSSCALLRTKKMPSRNANSGRSAYARSPRIPLHFSRSPVRMCLMNQAR